jgi:hypothetical protein
MSRLKLLSLIVVLAVTASPVAAQTSGSSGQGSNSSQGGSSSQSGNSAQTGQLSQSSTGVICEEEMTGTFCNTVTSSSSGGYGASSSSVGSATPTPIPACGAFPPANELCN